MPRKCPGCAAFSHHPFGKKEGHEVLQCAACGTLYCDCPPVAGGHYDEYYSDEHAPSFLQARLDQIVRAFQSYRTTNHLLDVGFGDGSMLDAAAREGWEVDGVEVSRSAVERARKRHPNVREATLAAAGFPDGRFDVVIASELLEHLHEPDEFLREVRRVLRPGGLFWATTPHGRGLSARVLGAAWSVIAPPDHIQLFSVDGMRMLLARAGFRRTRIDTHGADPIEVGRAIRQRLLPNKNMAPIHRVNSLQPLNRVFVQTRSGGVAKRAINAVLNVSRLGDSLKIFAEA